MKKIKLTAFLLFFFVFLAGLPVISSAEPEIQAPSVILIEAHTGTVLYEKNADEVRHPPYPQFSPK